MERDPRILPSPVSHSPPPEIRPAWLRYFAAILFVVLTTLARLGLNSYLRYDRGAYLFAELAVLASAFFGGLGPGLFATFLAALADEYFWLWPQYTFWPGKWQDSLVVALFVLIGIAISLLVSYFRRARRLAESRAAALRAELVQRKQIEEDLARAKEAAESASRAKDQFLAVLSHELRTPLNPVLLTTSLLEDDPRLSEDLRDSVDLVRRNVELEARLIDDLLDLTRIVRGKLALQRETVDAHTVLRHALDICEPDIQAKHLVLHLDFAASRTMLNADPARLQQIFWNLLKNAVKFTPEGGTITVRTMNDERGTMKEEAPSSFDVSPSSLFISVSDTGVGISPEALPRLFNAFEQGSPTVVRQFGGLGLGLAISRSLVEMHGGSIAAYSEGQNKGATFTVTLPLVGQ